MKHKKVIILLLAFTFCFSLGAAAAIKVTVELKTQEIVCNSGKLSKQVISYNGTTYVPLREFADLVNVDVNYKDNVIYLGDVEQDSTTTNKSYSYSNPAPINTAQTYTGEYTKDFSNKNYSIKISVTDIVRGNKAWEIISSSNKYISAAPEGKEYILVKVHANMISTEEGLSASIHKDDFMCFSGNNSYYMSPIIGNISNMLNAKLMTSSSTEGYVPFIIDKTDTSPKMAYRSKHSDTTAGIWFKISK